MGCCLSVSNPFYRRLSEINGFFLLTVYNVHIYCDYTIQCIVYTIPYSMQYTQHTCNFHYILYNLRYNVHCDGCYTIYSTLNYTMDGICAMNASNYTIYNIQGINCWFCTSVGAARE